MRVKCLFFAVYRDLLGQAELELELPDGTTLEGLIVRLRNRDGANALPASILAAVNQEYASLDRQLSDGDEVAFIPPVAGG